MWPEYVFETALVLSIAAVIYHHVGYPILLKHLAAVTGDAAASTPAGAEHVQRAPLPTIAVIVPAHNEQDVIAAKIENLSQISYPTDLLRVFIALDGCSDATKAVAEAAIARAGHGLDIRLVDYPVNRGKIAVLNDQIAQSDADIMALNDASVMIDPQALLRAAARFQDESVGVVCATYKLPKAGSEGEAAYWRLQTRIMAYEAAVAAPMGAHGPLYFIRRSLWQPLPADTINDDFVLPMRIVVNGHKSVYDQSIVATEIETTASTQEFRRRVRIGAGNMQQLVRLIGLANPRAPALAFLFLSGKGLRPLVPFLIVLAVLATLALALKGDPVFQLLLAAEATFLGAGAISARWGTANLPGPLAWLSYAVVGHTASAVGAVAFLSGRWQGPWKPSAQSGAALPASGAAPGTGPRQGRLVPRVVVWGKRTVDIVAALFGLVLLAIVFVPIAIAIKRNSRGPVLFWQQRVGRSTEQATYLFNLIKFRSMEDNAERLTGPVFSGANDMRVTKVGVFLRKTRLDELPQFINVLKGDMSLIGPRPERPMFVRQRDQEIPFYPERTTGLRPGITGLA